MASVTHARQARSLICVVRKRMRSKLCVFQTIAHSRCELTYLCQVYIAQMGFTSLRATRNVEGKLPRAHAQQVSAGTVCRRCIANFTSV